MISFVKGLFSAPKIAETANSMLDNAFFTDQEKSKLMLEYVRASAPMAVTRRIIACFVVALWALGIGVAGFLFLFGDQATFDGWSLFMKDNINTPFSVIMGFYFLAHVVSRGKT